MFFFSQYARTITFGVALFCISLFLLACVARRPGSSGKKTYHGGNDHLCTFSGEPDHLHGHVAFRDDELADAGALRETNQHLRPLVAVTGGAGFIGSHVVELLLKQGMRVRVVDDFSTGKKQYLANAAEAAQNDPSKLEIVRADLRKKRTAEQAVRGAACVAHLAAEAKVRPSLYPSRPEAFARVHRSNVDATVHVLRAAFEEGQRRNATPPRVVFASSSTVYAAASSRAGQSETGTPLRPITPYAATKAMAEHAIAAHARAYGVPALSLRIFMCYGPREPSEGAHAVVTGVYRAAAAAGKPAVIYGDGSQTRDFVHVTDVARAVVMACMSNRSALAPLLDVGASVNVGTGFTTTIASLAHATGLAVERQPERRLDLRATRADTCLARSALGFTSSMPHEHVFEHVRKPVAEQPRVDAIDRKLAPFFVSTDEP